MNQLSVNLQHSIPVLAAQGWSARKIARELAIDRETVGRYLRLRAGPGPKPAISTPGSAESGDSKPAISTSGSSEPEDPKPAIAPAGSPEPADPKPAISTPGSVAGRTSLCAPWASSIEEALLAGLSAQRIHQDLVAAHGFGGSYQAVKRFVRRLRGRAQLPFRRMEVAPGQELQVDFGRGAWVEQDGKQRRPHLFRAVLSHSRKAYSEVVWRQDTESFIRCLENAFRHFGGVTSTVVPDNLKAGVIQADWFDPELNPKTEEFARHYGTVILPTRPATPRHKGKIEAGVKYGQNNALKGRRFQSLAEQNAFLAHWEKSVADTRIHGTTRRQVAQHFETVERPALAPLPATLFPLFEEARRTVHRDGFVEFKRAYYSVPPEYVGREVWVRQEARLLRVLNFRREQIALHALAEPGRFTTDARHIHSRKRSAIERGADRLLAQCRLIGPHCGAWAEAMARHRGPAALRVMLGLLHLVRKHSADTLEKVAGAALHRGLWHWRDLKHLLERPENVVQIDFLDTHPLIRPLDAYRVEAASTPNPTSAVPS
jgi:transposase